MFSMKRSFVITAVVVAVTGGVVIAQQSATSRGSHDWAPSAPLGKHHTLAATLDTVQWGWLDPKEAPKLTVNSGDTVSIETMMHSHDKYSRASLGKVMICVSHPVEARTRDGALFVTGRSRVTLEVRISESRRAFCGQVQSPARVSPIGALASECRLLHESFA